MGKIIDVSGQKFGFLTPQYYLHKNNRLYWHCICDCGREIEVESGNLRSGRTKSCGCQKNSAISGKITKNIVGQKFNHLTVIEKTDKRMGGAIVWKCKCDCGNIINVPTGNLKSGHTQSCGCLKHSISPQSLQLEGQKFGKLTVLYRDREAELDKQKKQSMWKCLCDCGNTITIPGYQLTGNRHRVSCGCLLDSAGVLKISELLRKYNIPFEREKTFDDCVSPSGKLFRFDFYVDKKYIIEYDGEQHFYATGGWNTEENWKKVQFYDKIKDEWCKEHNIPLIRVPYTRYDDLTIHDILYQEEIN